jgi:hypothetical protein
VTSAHIRLDGVSPSWLADELDSAGVVRLTDVFSAEFVDALRASVTQHVAGHGEGDLLIAEPEREPGSPVHELVSDPAVQRLFRDTVAMRWPRVGVGQDIKCGIPVRAGTGEKAGTNLFHYDANALTMIVPIFIPRADVGSCGELVAFANKRRVRRFVASHLADMLLAYNPLYRRRVTRRVLEAPEKYVVDLTPGDAYVFWGYRTYHGNLVCARGLLRAVLVVQFGDVHAGSRTMSLVWRMSRSRRAVRRFRYRPESQLAGDETGGLIHQP